jgi:succinate dehydrogenase/fumarate reductase flavoprotein subunit
LLGERQVNERHDGAEAWDREVDLVVAGAGPAGMTAALVAAIEGLDVVVCEKSDQVGGTGATSAGTLWIPGNSQSRKAGYTDTAEDAKRYLDALLGETGDPAMRAAYLKDGPGVIDYLEANSDVRFIACGRHPDYRNNLPGSAVDGRAIIPETFDGRRLGRDFARVRPPMEEFMLLGGMMVGKIDILNLLDRWKKLSAFRHTMGLVLRYMFDRLRFKRGTRLVMGNALVARLYYSLKKRNVPVLFGAPLMELVKEDGRVVGAVVGGDGARQRIRARKGVVLATGGFAHAPEFRRAYMPQPILPLSFASEHDTGDGLRLGEAAGASVRSGDHQSPAFWSPASVTKRRDGSNGLFPHLVLDRAKPGLIAVNAAGRRFVNEGCSYHDFVEAMYRSHERVNTMPAWMICDAEFVRRYGIGTVHPETRNLKAHERAGYITVADSLDELAKKIKVDADGLADSVARNNRYAEEGSDPDFGKGDLELARFNGDASHAPNPCLGPIATPPFVALAVWPAEIGCSIGLATDSWSRVQDKAGRTVDGLYACGNDMSSVMSGSYPGPGTTLGPGVVFGWRAAMHAAGKAGV